MNYDHLISAVATVLIVAIFFWGLKRDRRN